MEYYNVICEEVEVTGGKIIHVDKNVGSLNEITDLLSHYTKQYPNAKWEIYPMYIK